MKDRWLIEAVSNNAAWCNAIAASHNIPAHWGESSWCSEHSMPPLYPNIVTLNRGGKIDQQIRTIDPHLPVGWGIKDSYKELDLERHGFTVAFEALWYCRTPNPFLTGEKNPSFHVETVSNQHELSRWVAAWGESTVIFKRSLLRNKTIELVDVAQNGQIVSGLATNHSSHSVGISNAFGKPERILECIAFVSEKHPKKGIVGYGSHRELAALSTVGFQPIGELQIWLRS